MKELEPRVETLEKDVVQIKTDLAILVARSEHFSTKADLLEVKGELRLEISELRHELKSDISGVRHKMQAMRVETCHLIITQTKWMITTMVGIAGATLALARFIFN